MHEKLAGHLSLHDMIKNTLDGARVKMAAFEEKDEKKDDKKDEKKDKKPNPFFAKKKDGGEDKDEEKKASIIDAFDIDEVEKLASALEAVGEKIATDKGFIGGESRQGGEVLAVMAPVSGKQPYKKDSSKAHNVPMSTGLQPGDAGNTAPTQVPNDHAKTPGGAPYPKKGVMKTAAEGVMAKIEAMKAKKDGDKDEKKDEGEKKAPPFAKKEEGDKDDKEKKSSVDFLIAKMAESTQGGMTLDSKSGEGPKPAAAPGRQLIANNAAPAKATKMQAKTETTKKLMSQVLSEPAMSKAHDSKVHENLRNASKGGVKIAAAKAFLQKIAEDPTDARHGKLKEAMKKALEKKSMGGTGMGASPAMAPPATV